MHRVCRLETKVEGRLGVLGNKGTWELYPGNKGTCQKLKRNKGTWDPLQGSSKIHAFTILSRFIG